MVRLAGFVGSVGVTAALVGVAATGTGAYFSDSKQGVITGTAGTIKIQGHDGSGADALGIDFTKLLPGEVQSKTVRYQNTGDSTQDVWVVFPQSFLGDFNSHTDTGLINDRGRFAEIHIASNGVSRFDSANLNDDSGTCPPGAGDPACNPLPHAVKVASNLDPGQVGDWTFGFALTARNTGGQGAQVLSLPYTLVATQHGVTPDQS
jgi:hypothetical protein